MILLLLLAASVWLAYDLARRWHGFWATLGITAGLDLGALIAAGAFADASLPELIAFAAGPAALCSLAWLLGHGARSP